MGKFCRQSYFIVIASRSATRRGGFLTPEIAPYSAFILSKLAGLGPCRRPSTAQHRTAQNSGWQASHLLRDQRDDLRIGKTAFPRSTAPSGLRELYIGSRACSGGQVGCLARVRPSARETGIRAKEVRSGSGCSENDGDFRFRCVCFHLWIVKTMQKARKYCGRTGAAASDDKSESTTRKIKRGRTFCRQEAGPGLLLNVAGHSSRCRGWKIIL